MTLPPELKEAEVSCEWIFRVMLKDARKLPSRTWLDPTDVASFLENARKKMKDAEADLTEDVKKCAEGCRKRVGDDSYICCDYHSGIKHGLSYGIAVFGGERK